MTDRDRLIELITEFYGVDPMYYGVDVNALADHLLANGVIVLPCKVGQTVGHLIKKALKCCMSDKPCCVNKCPFYENACENDLHALEKYALDYINRLEAENEELKEQNENLKSYVSIEFIGEATGQNLKKKIKANAYKEFAERLKKEIIEAKYQYIDIPYTRACNQVADWCVNLCDNLLKELVGDK